MAKSKDPSTLGLQDIFIKEYICSPVIDPKIIMFHCCVQSKIVVENFEVRMFGNIFFSVTACSLDIIGVCLCMFAKQTFYLKHLPRSAVRKQLGNAFFEQASRMFPWYVNTRIGHYNENQLDPRCFGIIPFPPEQLYLL